MRIRAFVNHELLTAIALIAVVLAIALPIVKFLGLRGGWAVLATAAAVVLVWLLTVLLLNAANIRHWWRHRR